MERDSRYWLLGLVDKRENILFKKGMQQLWDWAKAAQFIRLFTDGEYRYSIYLWPLAHEFLKPDEVSRSYRHRKLWRQGLDRGSLQSQRVSRYSAQSVAISGTSLYCHQLTKGHPCQSSRGIQRESQT